MRGQFKKYIIMSPLLSSFLFFGVTSCCFNNPKYDNKELQNNIKPGDTIIKQIPLTSRGNYSKIFYQTVRNTKILKLKKLEDGFDSIYIRLWYEYSFTNNIQVVEFSKTGDDYLANFYLFENVNFGNEYSSPTKTLITKSPKSGWPVFFAKLFLNKIDKLSSFEDLSGYDAPMDGSSVTVEIATHNKYMIYDYLSPKSNRIFPEADYIEKIMELIEEEFDIKRLSKI